MLIRRLPIGFAAGSLALVTSSAHAHISMLGELQSRGGDEKQFPCDGQRGDGPIYEFEPGATITLSISEGIPHPSYFRIAFDDDGDDDFVEPASIDPIESGRACPYDADDQCGESDFCNVLSDTGARVLWDNLDPHASSIQFGREWTWEVTLPDVECENCTLQVIQVMEDTIHGAYCPQGSCAAAASSLEDIYHRCVDIRLVRGASSSPAVTTGPAANNGIDCSEALIMPDGGVALPDASVDVDPGTGEPAPNPNTPGNGETNGGDGSGGDGSGDDSNADGASGTPGGGSLPPSTSDESSDGCTINHGAAQASAAWPLALLAFGLYRRRRSKHA